MPITQSNNIGFGEFGIYNSKNIGYGGMGIYSPENASNPVTEFLKYADWAILPDKADGINTGVNSPLTNPIVDLKGNADVTWVNMAGTVDDGYAQETINSKERTFANLDGIDTYGSLVAENAPNPTGLQDFAQLVVFKPDEIRLDAYYGVTRNDDSGLDMQYGFFTNASGGYTYRLGGTSIQINSGAITDITYALYGIINGRRFLIVNDQTFDEENSGISFITSNNVQLGCRSNSEDGLIKATFAKGNQGLCAMWYKGDTPLDKDKIVADSKKIVNYLYGL